MTAAGPSAASSRRWPRWMSILLVASLALNVLVAGAIAAAAWRHRFAPPLNSLGQATVLGFTRTMPESRRQVLWDAIRSERVALRPYRAEMRRARGEARAALVAEPFDADRYKVADDRVLDAEIKLRTAAHGLYHTMALKLTLDERRHFARWQSTQERLWRPRGGRQQEGSDGSGPAESETRAAPAPEPTK